VRDVDALEAYWRVLPGVRQALFTEGDRHGYVEARVETSEVKPTVEGHPDFQAFRERVTAVLDDWQAEHRPNLMALDTGSQPRAVIRALSEDLLSRFADVPLLDRYAVYQRLMDYWEDVMQDDVYLVAVEGWEEAAKPRGVIENKERKIKEEPDLVVGSGRSAKKYKLDLVPPHLVVARFFPEQQARLDELRGEHESATRALEEFIEEQEGEEDLLSEVKNDKGKVAKDAVNKRLKALKGEPDSEDEIAALSQCRKLLEAEASAKKAAKYVENALNRDVLARYGELTEDEIKTLVVDDKWLADIRAAVDAEVERITNQLAGRARELEERYAESLPAIEREVEHLAAKVAGHLEKMGVRADV
jgi:type I restriction enzyme M protein